MESTDNNLPSLPPEILRPMIHQFSHQTLCNVVLTCKCLHQIGSDPDLWADMAINKTKVKNDGIKEFLKIARFSKIKHIILDAGILEHPNQMAFFFPRDTVGLSLPLEDLTALLGYVFTRAITGNPLETLDLSWLTSMFDHRESELPTQLLVAALLQVRKLSLPLLMTPSEIGALLEAMPRFNLLEEFECHQNIGDNVRDANAQFLAEGICGLRKANLSSTLLNTEQVVAILSRSLDCNIQKQGYEIVVDTLKELNIFNARLYDVPSELLNAAVCRLERVNLGCGLGYQRYGHHGTDRDKADLQVTSLLMAIPSSTTLQSIKFYNTDMSGIDPVILAKAVCHVPQVELKGYCTEDGARLTTSHINEIVRCKLNESGSLVELDLTAAIDFVNDLSEYDCHQLGEAVARMRKVSFEKTLLSLKQKIDVLKSIEKLVGQSSTILEELVLEDKGDEIPEELLSSLKFVKTIGYPTN